MSQSLERALDVIDGLRAGPRSLDSLADELNVHKTTVLRLLRSLESRGYVRRDATHHYRVGPRLFELASEVLADIDVLKVSRSHLEKLNAATGQTVHLAILDRDRAVYIDKLDGTAKLRMYSRVGLSAPLHCTAVGKALLAWAPHAAETIEALPLEAFTHNTMTSREAVEAELAHVAETGWSRDFEEHELYVNCVGAPVRNGLDEVVAAVSVSAPSFVLPREGVLEIVPQLLEAAAAISAELGYRGEHSSANRRD